TLPLWFFKKQAFGVKEMESNLEMLQAEYKGKENSILFEINDAYARVTANEKLIKLYETAFIPQAQEAVNIAIKGYSYNKSDFLSVLDSQRMLLSFKLDYLNAILQFNIAVYDIEKLIGTEINF
ncbi:MAG: TolC family protein, partial [Endomicrobiaceae bacterium]|nr:TolC family protein [Endomicrobiaceae bacterium]